MGDEADLNAAIVCFNAKTNPGEYTIFLTQSIALTASTTLVNNPADGVSLILDGSAGVPGGGFALDGQDIVGVRPLEIAAGTYVGILNLQVTRGNVPGTGAGGGIRNLLERNSLKLAREMGEP